jgi:tetratricopeptide (TPR) repeat protein
MGRQMPINRVAGRLADGRGDGAARPHPVDDVHVHLRQALTALGEGRHEDASEQALRALGLDELSWQGWYLLGQAREKLGDFTNALVAYEAAFARQPGQTDIANDAGRIAFRLGDNSRAAQYFAAYHKANPSNATGANNLATALKELHHFDAAIDVLRFAIQTNPEASMLWNTLGTVLSDRGDPAEALIFFGEAARLDGTSAKARYNLATSKLTLGDGPGAMEDCDAAISLAAGAPESAMMRLGRSTILLCQGRLGDGWDQYEARLDPAFAAGTHFSVECPQWDLAEAVTGKSLLVFGEQGLGDQVSFSGTIPDMLNDLGPKGRMTIAVEPRLVPLFQRSFPAATTIPLGGTREGGRFQRHLPGFDASQIDLWTPMASPLRRYRRSLSDYPAPGVALVPDGTRVEHWRRQLGNLPGRKVGIVWKSLNMDGVRQKFFPAFHHWQPVFGVPGVTFVNLQYGDCAEEIEQAQSAFSTEIWQPPHVDLKDDLDGVAALAAAMDLVIGPSNATTCLAAACGGPTSMFFPPASWPCQGTEGLPWYPAVRGFVAKSYREWDEVMGRIAAALATAP